MLFRLHHFVFRVPYHLQVPKSNTTVIGRLVTQVSESPSPRWLVGFENYKDEEYAEETLGPVVGRLEEYPDASDEEQEMSPVHGNKLSGDGAVGNNAQQSGREDEPAETATRSTKRRTASQSGSSTSKTTPDGAHSSGESSPAEDGTNESTTKKKKKGVTFSSRSRSNSEVSSVPSPSRVTLIRTHQLRCLVRQWIRSTAEFPIVNSVVVDAKQRVRRRHSRHRWRHLRISN
jgi:hypothetical protein